MESSVCGLNAAAFAFLVRDGGEHCALVSLTNQIEEVSKATLASRIWRYFCTKIMWTRQFNDQFDQ